MLQFISIFHVREIMFRKFTYLLFVTLLLSTNAYAQRQTISIDVGHSLSSPGSTSAYGETEFSYNRDMALHLAKSFVNQGYGVNLIGSNGDIKDLKERPLLAKNSNLFISIHHDSIQLTDLNRWTYQQKQFLFNDEVHGFGIFVSTKNPYFKQSLQCAKNVAEKLITTGFKPNYYHAQNIKGENKTLFFPNLPVYQYDNLIVLKNAKIPAILIEVGVLTNRKEAKWIAQEDVKIAFSQTVSEAIHTCLNI